MFFNLRVIIFNQLSRGVGEADGFCDRDGAGDGIAEGFVEGSWEGTWDDVWRLIGGGEEDGYGFSGESEGSPDL